MAEITYYRKRLCIKLTQLFNPPSAKNPVILVTNRGLARGNSVTGVLELNPESIRSDGLHAGRI
jgi:hypothetical protein